MKRHALRDRQNGGRRKTGRLDMYRWHGSEWCGREVRRPAKRQRNGDSGRAQPSRLQAAAVAQDGVQKLRLAPFHPGGSRRDSPPGHRTVAFFFRRGTCGMNRDPPQPRLHASSASRRAHGYKQATALCIPRCRRKVGERNTREQPPRVPDARRSQRSV
jgi:hypothetical protein